MARSNNAGHVLGNGLEIKGRMRAPRIDQTLDASGGSILGIKKSCARVSRVRHEGEKMELGAFSVSLNVKDVKLSRDFYAKLGFEDMGGDADQGWLIMRNGETVIGLFGGFIEKNTLTFNPGWNQKAQNLDTFEDVRSLQKRLKADGIAFHTEADEGSEGPAHFVIIDPDGNPILVDQHR